MEIITTEKACNWLKNRKGENEADEIKQAFLLYQHYADHPEQLNADQADDIIIGLLERMKAGGTNSFSQKRLFITAYLLQYLVCQGLLPEGMPFEYFDLTARDLSTKNSFSVQTFLDLSPYLLLRYASTPDLSRNKARLKHTMLLQLHMLDKRIRANEMQVLDLAKEELIGKYSPANPWIQCLYLLYEYQNIHLFPARSQRILENLIRIIQEIYPLIECENRRLINTIASDLVGLPCWRGGSGILRKFDQNDLAGTHTLPFCVKSEEHVFMGMNNAFFIGL